jgi:hypothetical protein
MSNDQIRDAIGNAKKHLLEHPAQARYADRPATATIEHGLRCGVDGPEGVLAVTDMRRVSVEKLRLQRRVGSHERHRPAATPQ